MNTIRSRQYGRNFEDGIPFIVWELVRAFQPDSNRIEMYSQEPTKQKASSISDNGLAPNWLRSVKKNDELKTYNVSNFQASASHRLG